MVRLGIEAVAEDIEGFVEKDEAEGGAKLMVGPTIVLAPSGARWSLLLGGGVVTQLTPSTRSPVTVGALRDLQPVTGTSFARRSRSVGSDGCNDVSWVSSTERHYSRRGHPP